MKKERNGPDIRVIGISGSLRRQSYTRMAVQIVLDGAKEVGAQVEMLDLNGYDLKFEYFSKDIPEGVERLRDDVRSAHGIILGTPEYHGSYSGVLKFALDMMGFSEFEGKMIGLVGVAGGRLGGVNALNSLRSVGRSLHAWVIPEQVAIPQVWRQFNEQGEMKDERLQEAMLEVGRQVARFAYLHQSKEARDFLSMWETAPPNPGG